MVTFSEEADILPLTEDAFENLSDKIDAHLGEWSEFHLKNEFYVQGVDRSTAVLPVGWEGRLVELPAGDFTGYCLEPYDLCIAKLVANREKDIGYVSALIDAGIIDPEQLVIRSTLLAADLGAEKARIKKWLSYMSARKHDDELAHLESPIIGPSDQGAGLSL